MKLPRVRFTVRRLMLLIAGLAFISWLAAPAILILNDPGHKALTHLWQRPDGSYLVSTHEVSFWARYRHGLLGLPWSCSIEMCKEDKKHYREVDSGQSVDLLLREHQSLLKILKR